MDSSLAALQALAGGELGAPGLALNDVGITLDDMQRTDEAYVAPSADALDFGDEDELADDEKDEDQYMIDSDNAISRDRQMDDSLLLPLMELGVGNMETTLPASPAITARQVDPSYMQIPSISKKASLQSQVHAAVPLTEEEVKQNNLNYIKHLFPDYIDNPDTTNFTTMFFPRNAFRLFPAKCQNLRLLQARAANMEQRPTLETDQQRAFDSSKSARFVSRPILQLPDLDELSDSISSTKSDNEEIVNVGKQVGGIVACYTQAPVELLSWENDVLWDADGLRSKPTLTSESVQMVRRVREAESSNHTMSIFPVRNKQIEEGSWVKAILWDETDSRIPLQIEELLRDVEDPTSFINTRAMLDSSARLNVLRNNAANHDLYNLSNDKYYDTKLIDSATTTSKTTAFLQHAMPAVKLVIAFYQTDLTNRELRSVHRPKLRLPPKLEIKFSRIKALKKKRIKGKENVELMKTAKDVSLRDSAQFCLFEYMEEHPVTLSNPGMASIVYNYYRKKDDKDPTIPPSDFGAANILEPNDPSPFFGFGDVNKGETIPVLFNNLYRAPLFRHAVKSADFVVVRHTYKNQIKYFLREIPHLFVVGQALPVVEVPPPQSRLLAEYRRNRIKVAVYRLMRKKTDNLTRGVRFSELHVMFPQYGEIPLKSKLKEFMEGRGLASGHWRLKGNSPVPSEEEIRKLVTPELVCMYESLCASLRHLQDLGINKISDDGDEGDKMCDKAFELEQELAVWKITRNFEHARQGKIMLKLRGEGDPTGIGEGFSFLKAGAKEVYNGMTFDARGRFSAAEQKVAYELEMKRIWERQVRSLSSTVEPRLTRQQQEEASDDEKSRIVSQTEEQRKYWDDDTSSLGGMSRNGQVKRQRKLVILRKVGGPNGLQVKEEVVRDVKVINAYLRLQQKMKELQENYRTDTGSLEKQMLSAIRKEAKAAKDYMIHDFLTHRSQVQCSRCGMMGHIKTNRQVCPAYKGESDAPGIVKGDTSTVTGNGTSFASTSRNSVPPSSQAFGSTPSIHHSGDSDNADVSSSVKKRKESLNMSDLPHPLPSVAKHRRHHADVELSNFIEKMLQEVTAMAEAAPFLQPVGEKQNPDYRRRIQSPIDLGMIRLQNKDLYYRTTEEFLSDIRLLARNSEEYNGSNSYLTECAKTIGVKVVQDINKNLDKLRSLEEEITAGKSRKNKLTKNNSGSAVVTPMASTINQGSLSSMLRRPSGGGISPQQMQYPPRFGRTNTEFTMGEDEDIDVMSL